jgi:peroxiredoxin
MIESNQAPLEIDFTATDSEGKTIHLADFKGKKNMVLVFNRGFF